MHWTRQQRRLVYMVLTFFFMSWNFRRFLVSVLAQNTDYVLPGILFIWMILGLSIKQDKLPWEIPLYFALLKIIPLLPLELVCKGNIAFFTMALIIIFSFVFVFVFKRESFSLLFTGNLKERIYLPTAFPKNWLQATGIYSLVLIAWFFIKGLLIHQSLPLISVDILQHAFLMALYTSLAVFSIPLIFLRNKLDREELLIGLALGFGLFERYFFVGSFIGIILFLALGWFFARASYETRGSLLTSVMVFVYILTMVL